MSSIPSNSFAALLAAAKQKLETSKLQAAKEAADALDPATNGATEVDMSQMGITPSTLATPEGKEAAVEAIQTVAENLAATVDVEHNTNRIAGVARDDITLNSKQQEFHDRVFAGEDIVEIGPAGTGKTTSVRKTTRSLLDAPGRLQKLSSNTKYLAAGSPGAVIVSFTRKAVNNIRKAVVDELKSNTITIHKLLQFEPVFSEIEDPQNPGLVKKTMRFEPQKGPSNPLPKELTLVLFEESSMIGVELYHLLQLALPHPHQEVFLGDIQQLPPVFGLAILGFKMLDLPVVELTEVYRQARNSPILDLAWKFLEGSTEPFIPTKEVVPGTKRIRVPSYDALSRETFNDDGTFCGRLTVQPWQKKLTPDIALATTVKQLKNWARDGYYNPSEDMILCPYNKEFGTIELNAGISQFLGEERNALVHEVIAGFNKYYLAVGDRILYDKEDAFIVSIEKNAAYLGKAPSVASVNLNRWGHYVTRLTQDEVDGDFKASLEAAEQISDDDLLALTASEVEDRVEAASHVVTIRFAYQQEDGAVLALDKAAHINALLGGYAITVHKSQGSEYDNGFIILHDQHTKMCSRELLYTAVSRFKKKLHIICEYNTLYKAIQSQRIKGNTLKEKCELFKGKQLAGEDFNVQDTKKNGGEFKVQLPPSVETNDAGNSSSTVERGFQELSERNEGGVSYNQLSAESSINTSQSDGSVPQTTGRDRYADLLERAKQKLEEARRAAASKSL